MDKSRMHSILKKQLKIDRIKGETVSEIKKIKSYEALGEDIFFLENVALFIKDTLKPKYIKNDDELRVVVLDIMGEVYGNDERLIKAWGKLFDHLVNIKRIKRRGFVRRVLRSVFFAVVGKKGI